MALVVLLFRQQGFAGTLYYDTNGATGGTAASSTQNFTDSVWTLDPAGTTATTGYTAGSDIVFSADDSVNVGTGTQNVTVADTESAEGFTFDNGIVTLFGSGSPSLSIGAGGITVNSTVNGTTTFDSSLGTVTLSASQSWNNDSSQALNVNSAIAGAGQTLTFDGTGTGNVTLSGILSGNANLVQESASSTLYLTNNNTIKSTTISDDGTIVAAGSGSVGGTIFFTNGGGTLTFTGSTNFNHTLDETAPSSGTEYGATLNFSGDSGLLGGTNAYTANLLTIGSGDALDETTGTQSIATLDLLGNGTVSTGHRLIVGLQGQGFGLINGSTINVENGYTLDFGTSGTVANVINVQSGSAIENRSNGTVNLTNINLPTSGAVTLGADDVGNGALNITTPLALTGDLTIHLETARPTSVTLANISGNANLNITGATEVAGPSGSSVLYLAGTDTYTGATTLETFASPQSPTKDYAPVVKITGNSSGVGNAFNIQEGTLAIGSTASLPTGAAITLGYAGNGTADYFQVGDSGSVASATVASITSLSANGAADKIVSGNASVSNLTVDVGSGIDDIYYGNIGNGNSLQDDLKLTVDGPGILTLVRGDSYFTGGVVISGVGTLDVAGDSAIGPDSNTVTLTNGGTLFLGTSVPVYSNTNPTSGGNFNHNIVLGAGGGTLNGTGDYAILSSITGGTGLTLIGGDFLSETGSTDNVGTMNVNGGRLLAFTSGIFGNNAAVNVASGAILDFNITSSLNNPITLASGSALENRTTAITLNDVVLPSTGTVTLGADDVGAGSITITSGITLGSALTIDINENHTSNGGNADTTVSLNGPITGSGALTMTLIPGAHNEGTVYLGGASNYTGTTTLNGLTVYPGSSGFGASAVTLNNSTVDMTGGSFANAFTAAAGTDYLNVTSGTQALSGSIGVSSAADLIVEVGSSSALTLSGPINVASTGTLDFAWNSAGGTVASAITLADGSTLENRTNAVTLSDVVLPTTGTVTLGSDSVGGGSMTIDGAVNLTGPLILDVNANGATTTTVNLAGQISGSGPLTINPGPHGNSLLELSGNNSYSGPTTLNSVTVQPSSTGFGTSVVTVNSSAVDFTGGTLANSFTAGTGGTSFNLMSGSEVLSGPMELSTSGGYVAFANYATTGNLTVGSIDFSSILANRAVYVNDATNATGMIILNGTYTSYGSNQSNIAIAAGSTFVFGSNGNSAGNYEIGPNANFANLETNGFWDGTATLTLDAGNLYIDNSTFIGSQVFGAGGGYAGANQTYALVGSQDILAQLYVDDKHGPAQFGSFTVSQSTTNKSIWAGAITMDATQMTVSAVDGGRLDITGVVQGDSPTGLVKTGAGVVEFGNPNGNTFGLVGDGDSAGVTSTVAMDIQQGTLLVYNSQGYGLGNNSGSVKIEKGATLGGLGSLAPGQTVISENAGSIIAPGDAGQASLGILPSIGTLTLGRLAIANNADPTTNGITMDFKLTPNLDGEVDGAPAPIQGLDNDFISAAYINLSGTVTINITDIGGIAVGTPYTLFEASGGLTGDPSDPTDPAYFTLNINTPAGYALDPDYGFFRGTSGYLFDTTGGTLTVQFIAVPEPSTYLLLGLSLAGIAVVGRLRKASPIF
jgi:fibronectin-binding autotransporter adhesin